MHKSLDNRCLFYRYYYLFIVYNLSATNDSLFLFLLSSWKNKTVHVIGCNGTLYWANCFREFLSYLVFRLVEVIFCSNLQVYVRLLMLLMGSRQDERFLLVHWGSFLIMVNFHFGCCITFLFVQVANINKWISWHSQILQAVMHLLVRYVLLLKLSFPTHAKYISFTVCLLTVWVYGLWEHCYVWKKYFLVLGDISRPILWCYLGTVSGP